MIIFKNAEINLNRLNENKKNHLMYKLINIYNKNVSIIDDFAFIY